MLLRRVLRVSTALTVGLAATTVATRCQTPNNIYFNTKKSVSEIFSVRIPKVHALDPNVHRNLSNKLQCRLDKLRTETGFGDQVIQSDTKYRRLGYREFLIYYDASKRNPIVSYEYLTREAIKGEIFHDVCWAVDSRVDNEVYYDTCPYVRRQLAATENHTYDILDQAQTYFMTNVSPQHQDLSGVWKLLEEYARNKTLPMETEGVHIFTGPVWKNNGKGYLGCTKVRIPTDFFKIIITKRSDQCDSKSCPSYEVEAFLIPNEEQSTHGFYGNYKSFLSKYLVTVQVVDKQTGLDLSFHWKKPTILQECKG